MSYQSADWAWGQRDLKPTVRLTLLALANRCDGNHECFPRVRTIALDANISVRSATTALKVLTERGLIEITHQYHEDGSYRASLYHLCIPAPPCANSAQPYAPDAPGVTQDVRNPPAPFAQQEPYQENPIKTNPVIEETGGADAPAPLRGKGAKTSSISKRTTVEVDDPFRERMVVEYGSLLGSPQVVLDTIDLAMSHASAKKYGNQQLYVQSWLRRDAEKRGGERNGNAGRHLHAVVTAGGAGANHRVPPPDDGFVRSRGF